MLKNQSWRSTKADESCVCQAWFLTILGIDNLMSGLVTKQHSCGGSHIGQCEDLAQNALVHPVRELRQMAVTLVLHARRTLRLMGI